MPPALDADVALLHVAGGEARVTPPPGTLAQTPPRRAARGRGEDLLFVTVAVQGARPAPQSLLDQLSRLASDVFYGTPGSVTAALREVLEEANDHLVGLNQNQADGLRWSGRAIVGVLRGQDLYLAQCGVGQVLLVRPGQVTRFTSEEAAARSLGAAPSVLVRYHHLEVHPGDLLILTTAPPPGWSDPTLSSLSGLEPAQALDRLVAATSSDLTGILVRLTGEGAGAILPVPAGRGAVPRRAQPPTTEPASRVGTPLPRPAAEVRGTRPIPAPAARPGVTRATARRAERAPRSAPPPWLRAFSAVGRRVQEIAGGFGAALAGLLGRMVPGLREPAPAGMLPPGTLAATAVVVPLMVVLIAAVVYFRIGRSEQYREYLAQAQAAVVAAQLKPSPEEGWLDWEAAMGWLDLAESYRETEESQALRQQVQAALDSLNRILRLEFRPAVSGGFGSGAQITALAASPTDLYAYDRTRHKIWHAWGTGRGYEIDRDFSCLDGTESAEGMDVPVDMVSLNEPGALLQPGVVAIDPDGTLVYCAPESPMASSQLTPPDTGFGRIQAVDVFGDQLYVLDPVANSVWMYDASGGLFSNIPQLYFVEEVPVLTTAIDLALAQDQLLILFADGHVESCRRNVEEESGGGVRIRVECEPNMQFQDDRPGRQSSDTIPGAEPVEMLYSPPPEPSLYFLDSLSGSLYLYSMRLVYQGQLQPVEPFDGLPSAVTLGPPNDLFVAVGDEVFFASPGR